MKFSVSVITPVYNAASFIEHAVESALEQPETGEVILVEDGSPDNSLEVCKALMKKYEKVHLFQHPGGANRRAAPSRNLGMQNSTCAYIAFLDADDYYLPGRFVNARKVFEADPDCDGVYEAVGIHFEDERGKQRWLASDMAAVEVTTVKRIVPPEELFQVLIKGGAGHIHLNGLTIKRPILEKSGFMNEVIADTLHEDTDFILKVAVVGKLLPGSIEVPVSIRRVHAENRVSGQRPSSNVYRDHMRQKVETYRWCKAKGLRGHRKLVFKRMLGDCLRNKPDYYWMGRLPKKFVESGKLLAWPFEVPEIVLEDSYWKELLSSIWRIIKNPSARYEGL